MADWNKIDTRGNVEDRRSQSPLPIRGLSVVGIALAVIVSLLGGGNFENTLEEAVKSVTEQQQYVQDQFSGEDTYQVFASEVLGSANDTWSEIFSRAGRTYIDAKLVLFRQATESACGVATSRVGPHYCPADRTIYLDETFFKEMTTRYGAKGGDVAQAYVIAHEVGHHVQNILGRLNRAYPRDNETSIKIELQADCYAGIWANSIRNQGILEAGEVAEAMDAAAAVGDDRIQQKAQGYVNPETFTHGTSAQRQQWFLTGYEQGSINSCNTF